MRSHNDNWDMRMGSVQVVQQHQTIGSGHADIANNCIRRIAVKLAQGAVARVKNARLYIGGLQSLFQHPAN